MLIQLLSLWVWLQCSLPSSLSISYKTAIWKQLLAILSVYTLQLCYGMSSGYPVIKTPQLTMDYAQFPIYDDQESWIVNIDNLVTPGVCDDQHINLVNTLHGHQELCSYNKHLLRLLSLLNAVQFLTKLRDQFDLGRTDPPANTGRWSVTFSMPAMLCNSLPDSGSSLTRVMLSNSLACHSPPLLCNSLVCHSRATAAHFFNFNHGTWTNISRPPLYYTRYGSVIWNKNLVFFLSSIVGNLSAALLTSSTWATPFLSQH